jgi:hypothetical protein
MATKSTRYVAEERHEEFDEAGYTTDSDNLSDVVMDADASEPRCAQCGDLLAWHEEPCVLAAIGIRPQEIIAPETPSAAAPAFAYELGHEVLPLTGTMPRLVTWRGQLKERHPKTGIVHRVPVYRLDDGHWDCYREEELQVA